MTIVFILLASSVLFIFSPTEADPDIWGHLTFGQGILENCSIPRFDIYSYTSCGNPWINHEWLSETFFFFLYKQFGGAGLVVLKFFIAFIIAFLISRVVFRSTRSALLRILLIIYPLCAIASGFALRPQIFTYLFFAILVVALEDYERTGRIASLCVLPLIFLLWCNMHGGFAAGLVVLFVYLFCRLFFKKAHPSLVVVIFLSAAATLANPYGAGLWKYLAKALTMPRPYIIEWSSVRFAAEYISFYIVASLAAWSFISARKNVKLHECVILCALFIFAFRQNRHIALFAIAAAVFMPKYVDLAVGERMRRIEAQISPAVLGVIFTAFSLYYLSGAILLHGIFPARVIIREEIYPLRAVDFIRKNGIAGNLFAWFDWSQLCIRELSGQCRIFFDGRYETVYGDRLISDYRDIVYCLKDYNECLGRYPETDMMLIPHDSYLANLLSYDKNWVMIYSCAPAKLFIKNNSRNMSVIEKFRKKQLSYPRDPARDIL